MLTAFGKILRVYRIEHGLILKDMADSLGVPSSYLSALEMGRKTVSSDFLSKLFSVYEFSEKEKMDLEEAAKLSTNIVKINLENATIEKRNMALSFARKFGSLDEDTIQKILDYLK